MNFLACEHQTPVINKNKKRLNKCIEEEDFFDQSRLDVSDTDKENKTPENCSFQGHQGKHESIENKVSIGFGRLYEFEFFCDISADGNKNKKNINRNSCQKVKILSQTIMDKKSCSPRKGPEEKIDKRVDNLFFSEVYQKIEDEIN
jgi:hypothetical protein